MAKNKKIKINKSIPTIIILIILIIAVYLLCFTNPSFWFKKSAHEDAKSYSTKHCLVFYPDCSIGKRYAKKISKDAKKDTIYDYSLVPYGDYYLVNYSNGVKYFVDKDYKDIEVKEITDQGKRIIADYLKYTIKKNDSDKYYDSKFLEEIYIDNLDFTGITYEIDGESLKCRFDKYDTDVEVPLKYMQSEISMNFGYPMEVYRKPTYIDKDHTVICLTFDDGPQFGYVPEESSSKSIVDTLYKYDATATFYVVGYELLSEDAWTDYEKYSFIKKSINNGNEYGSHTYGHEDLPSLSTAEEIVHAIQEPADILSEIIDYKMITYRPPGGEINNNVLNVQPMPAILWDVDSVDWLYEDADKIYDEVVDIDYDDGDIIIFHDIYDSTAEAIKKIVPALIDKGYQLVTVSDMLEYEGIILSNLHYYYNLNPSPNYE